MPTDKLDSSCAAILVCAPTVTSCATAHGHVHRGGPLATRASAKSRLAAGPGARRSHKRVGTMLTRMSSSLPMRNQMTEKHDCLNCRGLHDPWRNESDTPQRVST